MRGSGVGACRGTGSVCVRDCRHLTSSPPTIASYTPPPPQHSIRGGGGGPLRLYGDILLSASSSFSPFFPRALVWRSPRQDDVHEQQADALRDAPVAPGAQVHHPAFQLRGHPQGVPTDPAGKNFIWYPNKVILLSLRLFPRS